MAQSERISPFFMLEYVKSFFIRKKYAEKK